MRPRFGAIAPCSGRPRGRADGAVLAHPHGEPPGGRTRGAELEDHGVGVGEEGGCRFATSLGEHTGAEGVGGLLEGGAHDIQHGDERRVGAGDGGEPVEVGEHEREVGRDGADEGGDDRIAGVGGGREGDVAGDERGGERCRSRQVPHESLGAGRVQGGGDEGHRVLFQLAVVEAVTTTPARREPFAPTAAVPIGSSSTVMVSGRRCG